MKHETGISPVRQPVSSGQAAGERILDPLPASIGPRITTFRGGAVHSTRPPGSQSFVADSHFAAVMLAPSPGMTSAFIGERRRTFDAPRGMLVINPAHVESSVKWTTPRENAVLAITPDSMLELAAQEFDRGRVDLPILPFGTIDPIALHIAEILKVELSRSEPPNELLIDSLITVFSIHLLRKYANSGTPGPRSRGGLVVTDARRVQDYMRENFSRKLSVADLAAICDLSAGHFIQAFTRTFGEPPHKYLVNLRLGFAEKLLMETDMTIAEVAYLSGFSSQSHLTSTMRNYKRITPAIVRQKR